MDGGWDCHVHLFDGTAVAGAAHYQPVARPLPEIEELAAAHGCSHLVLVQPSVYGTDNALLLRGLQSGKHRGVVVLQGDEELQPLHDAGVRGVRFNLVSPVGSAREEAADSLRALAPRLLALGWHVQWYVAAGELPLLARWQAETGLTFVLDHLGGMTPAVAKDEFLWTALATLAQAGSWIKLSGWYRLQSRAPYAEMLPVIQRVAGLFAGRMVWGSDWPHTSFPPDALPAYESVWRPVVDALGGAAAADIRSAGARLYSP